MILTNISKIKHLANIKLRDFKSLRLQRFHNRQQLKTKVQLPAIKKETKQSNKLWTKILFGSGLCFVAYDGAVNDFTYCGASVRFMRSLKVAALIAWDYYRLDENDDLYEERIKEIHQTSANRLLDACLLNGGLYIKVGQGFAAINHILPKEYTSTLSKLQDRCLPTSKEDVQQVFSKDFGDKPENIFAEFDYKPKAAASIAQVFKAKTHSGEEVAVKVSFFRRNAFVNVN